MTVSLEMSLFYQSRASHKDAAHENKIYKLLAVHVSEWVEFKAPLDTI